MSFLVKGVGEEGAVEDAAAQGEFVGVLNLVAHTHAARQDGDLDIGVGGQTAEDVEIGGVTLHRGAEGQDDLLDAAGLDTLLEAVHLDVTGANAVHGRNQAAQDVVEPLVLVGVLDTHHVLDILDNTDGRGVARGVAADGTDLGLADVVAHAAVADFTAQLDNRLTEIDGFLLVLLEQVQHKAERRLAPDARQLGKLADRRFQQP